ncbi:MAG: hypothetical protein QGG40_22720, partial [Myxococcota bacterium]|nr:hypothetical protein [Myxococcota bacterium]
RDIAMTFVLGDIGWGEGLQTARDLLDDADVPYVPVIGDNVIQAGDEERFDAMFAERYEQLDAMFPGWTQASTPSHNPEHDTDSWFQNFSFDHQGVHFVGLDWCSREMGTLFSEIGTLHDFEGGSWPWFEADIDAAVAQGGAQESVVMLTHIPMFMGPGGFDEADWTEIVGFTSPRADAVAANYAGHFHGNTEESFSDAGFELYITAATWDDEVTVRLVEVWGNGLRFEYHGEVVEWDW